MSTIKIEFDIQHNPIPPTLILATRSGKRLGQITNVSELFISDALNETPELTFKVSKYDAGKKCSLWESIVDFKLVYCVEWDAWFEISVELTDGSKILKSVIATALCQSELSQILLFGTEINTEDDIARDDFKIPTTLFDPEHPEASLLHRIMEKTPHYTVNHVDDSIKELQRTFSFDNTSIKDALDEIAEEINCLVVYGNENDPATKRPARTISLYDLNKNCRECGYRGEFSDVCPECGSTDITNEYGQDTTIFISKDNLTDEVTFSTDKDSVKNCFRLEAGDDNMTAAIRNCNPNGSGYIWYLSDEVKEDMPPELVEKLNEYSKKHEAYQKTNEIILDENLLSAYNKVVKNYQKYKPELTEIKNPITGYPSLMDVLYETIDMEQYLCHSLMPSVQMADTNAEKEAQRLTSEALSPVSVANFSAVSKATADSYILEAAGILVDFRFQVKIKSSTFNHTNKIWTGSFTVTNYSDVEDTSDTEEVTVSITNDYEQYVKQKLDKLLNKKDTEDCSISGIMKKKLSVSGETFGGDFANEIKKYSLSSLTSIHDCCRGCLDILTEQGIGDRDSAVNPGRDSLYEKLYLDYHNKLLALESEMNVRESELSAVRALADEVKAKRDDIQKELDFEAFLGTDLWKIFCSYRRDDLYKNDNCISDGLSNAELFDRAREFLKDAEKELYKSAVLQHSISSTLKNLLAIREFERLVQYFSVGNWIRIEIDGAIYRLRLISYDIRFDHFDSINVEFSDVTKIRTGISDARSILSKASSMSTTYTSVKRQAEKGKESHIQMEDWKQEGIPASDIKLTNDTESKSQSWDEYDMVFKKYDSATHDYDPTQMKIINSTIAITDDNWKTTKTAIGQYYYENPESNGELKQAYGINGETIVGKLLLGETLGIYNDGNSMKFDNHGLRISNGVNTFAVNPQNGSRLLQILKSEGTKESEILYVDKNGKLRLCGGRANLEISSSGEADSITLADGELQIYDIENGTERKVSSFDRSGAHFYSDGKLTGGMVSTGLKNADDKKGLHFTLNEDGEYMCWAAVDPKTGSNNIKLAFYRNDVVSDKKEGLHLECDTYADNNLCLSDYIRSMKYGDGSGGFEAQSGKPFFINCVNKGGVSSDVAIFRHQKISFGANLDMQDYDILNQSDARLKDHIKDTSVNALDIINQIDMKQFDWIKNGEHEDIGIIAQQLQMVLPELVHEDSDTGKLSIKTTKFIPYLIKAVQELSQMVQDKESESSPSKKTPLAQKTKKNHASFSDDYTLEEKKRFVEKISPKNRER